jgi:5'-3' exonuclease
MGIPSYFSYIVKNHSNIIKRLSDIKKKPNNLYIDSNSIIYDCLRKISSEYHKYTDGEFEDILIANICSTIDGYIKITNPNKSVLIAFDGVAPFAKMEQQKTRRYKSGLESEISSNILGTPIKKVWDRTAITPGTIFMRKLGSQLMRYYKTSKTGQICTHIMVSDSGVPGEGEHKIFQYIRDNPIKHAEEVTLIYGLDADLIMLGLNHLPISKNIYLYRETPEFIKSIDKSLEPNEDYILDLPLLAEAIINKMNGGSKANSIQKHNRLYDYIFLCFFLGNDFMPHFPSINIRTSGVDTMIAAYQNTIGRTNENLTNGKTIFWKNVRILIEFLANSELRLLKQEYGIRNRQGRRKFSNRTDDDKLFYFQTFPLRNREKEEIIDPYNEFWEERYYKVLFKTDINDFYKKKIAINYLEGLEWTMKYYTSGCVNWYWGYEYSYPPLLKDLLKYIPHWETTMCEKDGREPVHPYVQLAYVLPKKSFHLLPHKLAESVLQKYQGHYDADNEITWAFCKYFWESHIDFTYIDFEDLETYILGLIHH